MNININAGIKGKFFLSVYDANDNLVSSTEQNNMILNNGLVLFLNDLGNTANMCIGTGSTPVSPTDTSLAEDQVTVSTTVANWINSTNTISSGGVTKYRVLPLDNGSYKLINTFTFTYGTLNGTYTELGFWTSGAGSRTNLLSRALLDTPVTVPSDYRLIVTYEIRITPATSISNNSITARGITYNYKVIPNISNTTDVSGIEYSTERDAFYAPAESVHFLNRGFTNQLTKAAYKTVCYWEPADYVSTIPKNTNAASSKFVIDTTWTTSIDGIYRKYTFTDIYLTQTGTTNNYVRTPSSIKAIGLPVVNLNSGNAIPLYIIEFTPELNIEDLRYSGSFSLSLVRL